MNEQTNTDIDYENMDDLPLSHRIEWSHFQIDKEITDTIEIDHVELQAI